MVQGRQGDEGENERWKGQEIIHKESNEWGRQTQREGQKARQNDGRIKARKGELKGNIKSRMYRKEGISQQQRVVEI